MKVKAFFLGILGCVTMSAQQTITPEVLTALEGSVQPKSAERALRNAIQSTTINKMTLMQNNPQAN